MTTQGLGFKCAYCGTRRTTSATHMADAIKKQCSACGVRKFIPYLLGVAAYQRRAVPQCRKPTLVASSGLARVYVFAEAGAVDAAIDAGISLVDGLLSQGRFMEVDEVLRHLAIEVVDTDVTVAMLMATTPAREQLHCRPGAVQRLIVRLAEREPADWQQIIRILGCLSQH